MKLYKLNNSAAPTLGDITAYFHHQILTSINIIINNHLSFSLFYLEFPEKMSSLSYFFKRFYLSLSSIHSFFPSQTSQSQFPLLLTTQRSKISVRMDEEAKD